MSPQNLLSILLCALLAVLSVAAPASFANPTNTSASLTTASTSFTTSQINSNSPETCNPCFSSDFSTSTAAFVTSTTDSQNSSIVFQSTSDYSSTLYIAKTTLNSLTTANPFKLGVPATDRPKPRASTISSAIITPSVTKITTPMHLIADVSTSTTSSELPVHSKTDRDRTAVEDCNFEGEPSTLIIDYTIEVLYAENALVCQNACEAAVNITIVVNTFETPGTCQSYAYHVPAVPADPTFINCELFSRPMTDEDDGDDLVVKEVGSGIFYSNRWPGDASGFCYWD